MGVGVWCVCVCLCECLRVCMGVWVREWVWVFMLAVTYLVQPSSVLSPQSSLRLKLWMPVMGGDLLHLHMTVPIVDGGSLHAI